MKTAVVNLSDLSPKTGNHRMCLSARRSTGLCYNCRYYENCESKIPSPALEAMQSDLDKLNSKTAAQREKMKDAGIKRRW